MSNQHEKPHKEHLIEQLDPSLRDLGREVLNPATTAERLRKIIDIGKQHHATKPDQAPETPGIAWDDYTDDQLSGMLASDDIPGHVKDDIARYVVDHKSLPPENE